MEFPTFYELAAARVSCRRYADKPVETDKLLACVETARLSPSAVNSQPWHFTVVNGGTAAAEVARCVSGQGVNKFAQSCPAFIVITEAKANLSARAGGLVRHQDFASVDIGIAAAHLCLQAEALGLSTCILGWFDEGPLKKMLGMDKKQRIRLVVCVGYAHPDGKPHAKKRKSFAAVCRIIDGTTTPEVPA